MIEKYQKKIIFFRFNSIMKYIDYQNKINYDWVSLIKK